MKQSKHP